MNDPRWLRIAAHPAGSMFSCYWLMVLLVCGTISQKVLGLYGAQDLYFSSWWLWAFDLVPVPSSRLVLSLVFLNLVAFLFTAHAWQRIGLLITHCGALLLLLGGFITALHREEGTLTIPEGGRASLMEDNRRLELAITDTSDAAVDQVLVIPGDQLQPGTELQHELLACELRVDRVITHGDLVERETPITDGSWQGLGATHRVIPQPTDPRPERNLSAMELSLHGSDADGRYLLLARMIRNPQLRAGGRTYTLALRPATTPLPFAVELVDFRKDEYAGTSMAAAYEADIVVHYQGQRREAFIEMNRPYRLAGYTLYQASFLPHAPVETTVLQVVKDGGQWAPYVSSIIMCIGLLIHLVHQVPRQVAREEGA